MSKPDKRVDEWAEIEAMFPVDTDDEQLNFANANKIIGLREARPKIADFYRNKILEALLAENKLYEDWFNADDNVHIEDFIARRNNHITAQFNSRGKDNE